MKIFHRWPALGLAAVIVCLSSCFAHVVAQDHLDDLPLLPPARAVDPVSFLVKPGDAALSPLDRQIDLAIAGAARRPLSAEMHTPWQIAHGVLALRRELMLHKGSGKVPALDWIASGPSYKGRPWFLATRHGGKGHPFTEPRAFEGHPNQFLALFTFCDLPREFEFRAAGDRPITIGGMLRNAQMEVNEKEEVAWTLWALSHYLDPEATWINQKGETWSMERMVRIQMGTPVTRSACGGTHGLFAIAKVRNAYLQEGRQLRGTWFEAHMHVKRYVEEARSLQNPDGSFSSEYFKGPGHTRDVIKRITTSGHTLEFLMMALPQDRLAESWVQRAVAAVARDLNENQHVALEPGGMYHAVDSLVMYRQRTRPDWQTDPPAQLADKSAADPKPVPKEPKLLVPPPSVIPIEVGGNAEEKVAPAKDATAPDKESAEKAATAAQAADKPATTKETSGTDAKGEKAPGNENADGVKADGGNAEPSKAETDEGPVLPTITPGQG